jgi:glycosyltransferase involved in cell wall biosynthesis
LSEGFGLPLLEAMSVGTPVVASDIPVMREVAGPAALYATGGDPDAWTSALELIIEDAGLRTRLSTDGRTRAAQATWDRTTVATVEAYARLLACG